MCASCKGNFNKQMGGVGYGKQTVPGRKVNKAVRSNIQSVRMKTVLFVTYDPSQSGTCTCCPKEFPGAVT